MLSSHLLLLVFACVGGKEDTAVEVDTAAISTGSDDGADSDGTGSDDGTDSDDGTGTDDGTTDDGGGADDTGGTGTDDGGVIEECDHFDGTMTGLVKVERTYVDSEGDTVALGWDKGDDFPYGRIYLAAYLEDEKTGALTYYADAVIAAPDTAGDVWSITTATDDTKGLRVYAALDLDDDRVVSNAEPVGNYPRKVFACDGDTVEDVNISILVSVANPDGSGGGGGGDGGGSGGGGTGGGGGTVAIDISGDINITTPYGGGEAAVLLLDSGNSGPYAISWTEPTGDKSGATSAYDMRIYGTYSSMQLVGGWDSNGNTLLDPTDTWGAYVSKPDVDGNPIDITEDIDGTDGWDIQIPMEDYAGLEIIPFIRIRGEISSDVDFDYGEDAVIYMTALKYRPTLELSLSAVYDAYDYVEFAFDDFDGENTIDYELIVPANTITYVWAYLDLDGDEILQEPNEAVGPAGSDDGRVSVLETNLTIDILLVEPPPEDTGL